MANSKKDISVLGSEQLSVTSLFDLQSYKEGTVVRLPDFTEGQPLVARVRRPSMLALAKSGKIPNALLSVANELFNKGGGAKQDEDTLGQMYTLMEIICESALIEPSLPQIKEAGMELTDEQMMVIFNYSQVGVKALAKFRKDGTNT